MNDYPKPNIVTLFESYGLQVVGPDRGGWRKATCPLPGHEDQNPSASVNEDLCRWHCHACNESGDAVDLIEVLDELGHAGAIALAQSLVDGDGGAVREGSGRSGLLPRGSRSKPGGSTWRPPWARL